MKTAELLADVDARMDALISSAQSMRIAIDALKAGVRKSSALDPSSWGTYRFGDRSLRLLGGVHPDLAAVAHLAIRLTPVDFGIPLTGGRRSPQEQAELIRRGRSRTMDSRHLTGHALDVYAFVDGEASWDKDQLRRIHNAFAAAADALSVPLEWGGNWLSLVDMPHHQLPTKSYGRTNRTSQSEDAAAFLAAIQKGTY